MKKNILILMALLIISSFSVTAADPTCSIVTPASSSANSGTVVFNATIDSNYDQGNVTGINFSVAGVVVGSDTDGINSSFYNASVDTTTITDVKGTTVTADIIVNGSALQGSCTATSVDFDNTNPVCSCTLEKEKLSLFREINYDCSATTDTTDLTFSAVATYSSGQNETETGERGTFEETTDLGEVTVKVTVSDSPGNNNTCSDLTTRITGDGDIPPGKKPKDKNNAAMIIFILAIVVVAVAIVPMMLSSKKNGKKRHRKK